MTEKAQILLHALSVCVRALTIPQAMRFLGIQDTANFRRFLSPLVAAELIEVMNVLAKPVPEMREPLFSVVQGSALEYLAVLQGPHETQSIINRVLYLARRRWAGLSAVDTSVIVATRKAGQIYGVCRAKLLPKPLQATHDLAVSEVFISKHNHQPVEVEHWYGEDAADLRLGFKQVDAIIKPGTVEEIAGKVIECIGADYSHDKLLTIARECDRRGLSYEFW